MANEKAFAAQLASLSPLAEWLNQQTARLEQSDAWRFALDLAACEVATNIIRYSLHEDPAASFQVRFYQHDGEAWLVFTDSGKRFPAERLTKARQELHEEMTPDLESGRGLTLILLSVDEFTVETKEGVNIATLSKKMDMEA